MNALQKPVLLPWHLVAVFLLLAAGIGAAGYIYLNNQMEHAIKEKQNDLDAIAALKVSQIASWRKDRQAEAESILTTSFIVSHAQRWLASGGKDAVERQALLAWMIAPRHSHHYRGVYLFDPAGELRLSSNSAAPIPCDHTLPAVREATRTQRVSFLDFHAAKAAEQPHLSLIVPLLSAVDGHKTTIGVLVFEIDPHKFLYPLIQSWPTPSPTAEIQLVRRDGDEVLFLNELRHDKAPALSWRLPLSNTALPAVKAVLGKEGMIEGKDYRHVDVFAALRKIPNSPWFLVTKVDRAEVVAPLHERVVLVASVGAALIFLSAFAVILLWRQQQMRFNLARHEFEEEILHRTNIDLESRVTERTCDLQAEIAQHRQTESALKESEARFRMMADCAPVLIWLADSDMLCIYFNKTWLDFTGRRLEQELGFGWREVVHPDDLQRCSAAYSTAFDARQPFKIEFRLKRSDGEYRWMVNQGAPRFLVSGEFAGYIGSSIDISESRLAHDNLSRQTEDLARSNADLEQFAYIASHDLQEPLRMVASYVQLLSRRYHDKLDQDGQDFVTFAVEGVTRMQRLINDLLAYSLVGTDSGDLESVDCNQVLAEVSANLRPLIQESRARISQDPLPTIPAVASQIGQLLQNLIGNAIKFHGAQDPEIHLSARQEGGYWVFAVRDNGIGIAPEYFDKVFMIFKRLHSREKYPGTGIGLAICKRIVERHHGRIWVESEPGQGATFCFTIRG